MQKSQCFISIASFCQAAKFYLYKFSLKISFCNVLIFFLATHCDFEEGTQWTEGKKEKGARSEKLRTQHNL